MKILAIYDAKAEAFMVPFFSTNTPLAVRQFGDVCNNAEHDMCKFAEDFTLFELGDFDEKEGRFDLLAAPKSVVVGMMLRKQKDVG